MAELDPGKTTTEPEVTYGIDFKAFTHSDPTMFTAKQKIERWLLQCDKVGGEVFVRIVLTARAAALNNVSQRADELASGITMSQTMGYMQNRNDTNALYSLNDAVGFGIKVKNMLEGNGVRNTKRNDINDYWAMGIQYEMEMRRLQIRLTPTGFEYPKD